MLHLAEAVLVQISSIERKLLLLQCTLYSLQHLMRRCSHPAYKMRRTDELCYRVLEFNIMLVGFEKWFLKAGVGLDARGSILVQEAVLECFNHKFN